MVYAGGYIEAPEIMCWSMSLVGNLRVASPDGFVSVEDFLPVVIQEVIVDVSGQYEILKQSMEFSGQVIPLFISSDMLRLRDGIHRVALATLLGWKTMTVSSTKMVWSQWDESPQGQEYHKRWNYRLDGLRYVR